MLFYNLRYSKKMKKNQNTYFYLFISFLSSMPLFMFGYIGSFTRFLADDYCSIYFAKELGLIGSVYHWYTTLGGGYSAFSIDWLILSFVDAYHIYLIPPTILVLWTILSALAIYQFLGGAFPKKDILTAITIALLAIFTILVLNPNIHQNLYWWGGMRAYTLPLIILTFVVFASKIILKRIKSNTGLAFVMLLSILFFFTLGGFGGTYITVQLALFLFLIFIQILNLKKIKKDPYLLFLLVGLIATLISLWVNLHSYGNVIRRSLMPPAPDLVSLIRISIDSFTIFVADIFQQKEKVLALLGAMLTTIWIGKEYKEVISVRIWQISLYFLGGILLAFASFPPGVYGYAAYPPTRTLVIGVFMLVTFFLYASFLLGGWLSQKGKFLYNGTTIAVLASIFLLFSATITTKSLYESRGTYIAFAEKWDRVDAEILEAKASGAPSITIEAMNNWAGLDRPNENPKWWPTECYSLYYDILVMGPPYSKK